MKSVLLIIPRFSSEAFKWYNFPLGLPYISAFLKQKQIDVVTLNLNHYEDVYGTINNVYQKKDIFLTGLSVSINDIKHCKHLIKRLKQYTDNIVVGGGLISGDPFATMKMFDVKFGIMGEGEIAMYKLCLYLQGQLTLTQIEGLVYMEDGKYRINNPKVIDDIDALPWPDLEGFNFNEYLEMKSDYGESASCYLPILTSRSCPFQCTFCFHTCGKKYRQRSIEDIFYELDYRIQTHNIQFIVIYDELLASNIERLKIFCKKIKCYNLPWSCSIRADFATPKIIRLLKNSNCVNATIGVESHSQQILDSMKKNITISQIDNALECIYYNDMVVEFNLLFGDVKETIETSNESLNWAKENPQYNIHLAPILVLPGSKIYDDTINKLPISKRIEYLEAGNYDINITKLNSKDYNKTMQKIEIFQNELSFLPKSIFITKNKAIRIRGFCNKCGNKLEINNVGFEGKIYMHCEKCMQSHHFFALDFFKKEILTIIKKYISINSNIILIGRNHTAYKLAYLLNYLNYPNSYIYNFNVKFKNISLFSCKNIDLDEITRLCDNEKNFMFIDCRSDDDRKKYFPEDIHLTNMLSLIEEAEFNV